MYLLGMLIFLTLLKPLTEGERSYYSNHILRGKLILLTLLKLLTEGDAHITQIYLFRGVSYYSHYSNLLEGERSYNSHYSNYLLGILIIFTLLKPLTEGKRSYYSNHILRGKLILLALLIQFLLHSY